LPAYAQVHQLRPLRRNVSSSSHGVGCDGAGEGKLLKVGGRVGDDVGSSGQELHDSGQKFFRGISLYDDSQLFFLTTLRQLTTSAPTSV